MIYPIQKVLPLSFPGESTDTLTERIPDLGPLHLHICKGIDFTSEHQLPVVRPEIIEPPVDLQAFYRLKNRSDEEKKVILGHFYTTDNHIERVWSKPHSFINQFRMLGGILSPDFSLLWMTSVCENLIGSSL